MKAANPYLVFNGNAEEAFTFYKSVFGGDFAGVVRFKDMQGAEEMPGNAQDLIANIALPIGEDNILMGSDTPDSAGNAATFGDNVFINIEAESAAEADRLFHALSDGGQVKMPLDETEWAEKFGMCADEFGVQWMVNYTGEKNA